MASTDDPVRQQQIEKPEGAKDGTTGNGAAPDAAPAGRGAREARRPAEARGIASDGLAVGSLFRP